MAGKSNVSSFGLSPERVREMMSESAGKAATRVSVDLLLFSPSDIELMKSEAKALKIELGEYLARMVNAGLSYRRQGELKSKPRRAFGRALAKADPYQTVL